jgi:ABC-type amino acid transport substrate-binding protein
MNYFIRTITYTAIRLIIILITLNSNSWSQEDTPALTIYAIELDHRLSENGDTQYNALLNLLTAGKERVNVTVRPLSRTLASFKKDKASCIFPATISAMTANGVSIIEEMLISSAPIDRVSLRILTKVDKPTIKSLNQISNQNIAVINGFNPNAIPSSLNTTIEYTSNEEIRLKMLNADRVSAVIGFVPDILLAAEALNIPVPNYDENLSLIAVEGVKFICHNSVEAKNFLATTNQSINQLKNTGKLKAILGSYADIVPIGNY